MQIFYAKDTIISRSWTEDGPKTDREWSENDLKRNKNRSSLAYMQFL